MVFHFSVCLLQGFPNLLYIMYVTKLQNSNKLLFCQCCQIYYSDHYHKQHIHVHRSDKANCIQQGVHSCNHQQVRTYCMSLANTCFVRSRLRQLCRRAMLNTHTQNVEGGTVLISLKLLRYNKDGLRKATTCG